MTKAELLISVLKARAEVNVLEEDLRKSKEVKQEAEKKLIEMMELLGESSFKTEEGTLVIRRETLYASPIKEKKVEVYRWVDEECGRSDLIKPSIHPRSFTSFINTRLAEKLPVPAELVKFYFKPELVVRNKGG